MGISVTRRMVGGVGSNEVGVDARASLTRGTTPTLFKAVVVDVLFDPDSLDETAKTNIKNLVSNPEFVDTMSPNTIVARIVTNGQDLTNNSPALFFPLFSSHFQLPLQAGEMVCVLFEDYEAQGTTNGKWVSRIHENSFIEDVNYTHSDRRLDPNLIPSFHRLSDNSTPVATPTFPNGAGVPGAYTLAPSGSLNPYDVIVNNSFAAKIASREPVPRWIKRPQELVMQGMNNSLIVLGQDRTGPALRVSGSNQKDRISYAGIVDVVCGRGRGGLPYDPSLEPNPTNEKTGTTPTVITNSRNEKETHKTLAVQNKKRNPNEGNADFKRDAARIYVAMNTLGDDNFRTGHSTDDRVGFSYPDNTKKPTQTPSAEGGIGNSYVVTKADHVRIIGRKETDPNISGDVLVLREGTSNDDLSFLFLEGGSAQLEAKEIFFGQATAKNEPYIKWSVYESHITELKNQIKALADQMKTITAAYNNAFVNSVASPFVPIATLASTGPLVDQGTGNVINAVKQRIDTINPADAKSRKLFGE